MSPLFEFTDVHVVIEDAAVLTGVTVVIPEDKLTVIAGVSGSGKTSLLRLCNRLDAPTRGTIAFRGESLATMDPRALRRRVGMVFQRPVLFAGTVRDNLLAADEAATDSRMQETLAGVDLDASFLDRIGDDLSGGEAQRVCLARALMCRPQVLLMDEPTSSLHPGAGRTLEATVTRLNKQGGVDVVWVTHDLAQITRLAEHLIVLTSGGVAYAGEPATTGATQALAALTEDRAE